MDAVFVEVFYHLFDYLFFPGELIERHDDNGRLMTEASAKTLQGYSLRGGIVGKDSIPTVHKIGILVEDIH